VAGQNNQCHGQIRRVLLKFHAGVARQYDIESLGGGAGEQFAVAKALPLQEIDRDCFVFRQEMPEVERQILIQQDFYFSAELTNSFLKDSRTA
jgi:hypothetical protein